MRHYRTRSQFLYLRISNCNPVYATVRKTDGQKSVLNASFYRDLILPAAKQTKGVFACEDSDIYRLHIGAKSQMLKATLSPPVLNHMDSCWSQ